MQKWDKETTEAIKKSIEHHQDNLDKLRNLEGEFISYLHFFEVGNKRVSFESDECALCQKFLVSCGGKGCKECPLTIHGYRCDENNSPWKQIQNSKTRPKAIKAEKNMVRVLKEVRGKEKILDMNVYYSKEKNRFFQVKNKTLSGAECGDFTEYYGDAQTIIFRQTLSNSFILNCLLVKNIDEFNYAKYNGIGYKVLQKKDAMSKYDELKARIEKVTAWDKEADDIIRELNMKGKYYLTIMNCDDQTGHVAIYERDSGDYAPFGGGEETKFVFHIDQCSKLEAFKKALMWLLENSSIKKTIVGQEVKAEIEGKVYKVKVIKED